MVRKKDTKNKINLKFFQKFTVVLICVFLLILPFTWFKPGEMDLGGDSTRLYFYDPLNFLKNTTIYAVLPEGTGNAFPSHYLVPHVIILYFLKKIFHDPYVLISILNALKLCLAFYSVYLILKEIVGQTVKISASIAESASVLGGLFYIFTPAVIGNWEKALVTHNQVFLNPLIFYLILKYIISKKTLYLLLILMLTFIFSPNFSLTGAPPFFSFYPLSIIFLAVYIRYIRKLSLPWKELFAMLVVFVILHAFQLYPQFHNLLDKGSIFNVRLFDKQNIQIQSINYFLSTLPAVKVSWFILLPSYNQYFWWAGVLFPLLILLSLAMQHKERNKVIVLTAFFYLVTLFLVSANITKLWVNIYIYLFYIPGFSMFRNFSGQWQFVYVFFYALLLGIAIGLVYSKISRVGQIFISIVLVIVLVGIGWPFLTGELINRKHIDTEKDVYLAMSMDPKYEQTLEYIRKLPGEGKILTLPFSDASYQVIHGTNNGAYVGPSSISLLTDKSDFSGYATVAPFTEIFYELVRDNNFVQLKKLLGLLNIKYIFYNSDPNIYDDTFPRFPYSYVRNFFPKTQEGVQRFIDKLGTDLVYENSVFRIYEIKSDTYLPLLYIPTNVIPYDEDPEEQNNYHPTFFLKNNIHDERKAYITMSNCRLLLSTDACNQTLVNYEEGYPKILFQRINPTKYKISVSDASKPYFLVFSQSYNNNWKLYLDTDGIQSSVVQKYFGQDIQVAAYKDIFLDSSTFETWHKKPLAENRHTIINGYANGWLLTPDDAGGKADYELILEMTSQRFFYQGSFVSLVTLLSIVTYIAWIYRKSTEK